MKLKGKVAVVTGSSRGIGKAVALALAAEGADIAVVARTTTPDSRIPGTIHETADQVRALGRRCLSVQTDLTKEEDIQGMAARVIAEFGRTDILVNNAGIALWAPLVETETKRWDLVLSVNLRSTFLCTKYFLPQMLKQRSGRIINVSAESGTKYASVENTSTCYSVAKAGVDRLTTGLSWELKDSNIAVNALAVGPTLTEGVKIRHPEISGDGWVEPAEWARYAALLAAQSPMVTKGKILSLSEVRELFPCADGARL